ncbi:hypothetical protein LCGC14_1814890 [marine sediment metagenome]|uniref:Uncharacterized protein n=1 Tax=marine sediment metagenome TaxID=412755 RepID=A0A0F9GKJ2_9ZZZZ
MKSNYLKLLKILTNKYQKKFGNIWGVSLLSEKNPVKTRVFHNIMKEIKPEPVKIFPFIMQAVGKYFSFGFRYCLFLHKESKKPVKNLFVTYNENHLESLYSLPDSEILLIPQKTDWKEVWNSWQRCLYEFIRLSDFAYIGFKYVTYTLVYLRHFISLKNDICLLSKALLNREDGWELFREEIIRSFVGDVLIENLFYERIFQNINKNYLELEKIIYPYEGQNWEKALIVNTKAKSIGVLCTIPSHNMMSFWGNAITPDHIGVIGLASYYQFKDYYGDKVFILGSTRHQYLKDVETSKGTEILVLLGHDDYQNQLLLEYAEEFIKEYRVRYHPTKVKPIYGTLKEDLMSAKKIVLNSDSMVSVEAYLMGIQSEIVLFEDYVDLNPLEISLRRTDFNVEKFDNRETVKKYLFEFNSNEEMIRRIEEL